MMSVITDKGTLTAACMLNDFVGTQREISDILQKIVSCIYLDFFFIVFHMKLVTLVSREFLLE